MSKLSMAQVHKEVQELGYSYVSGTYSNLKSIIVVKCKNGHEVTTTLHDLRKKRPCPVCSQFEYSKEEEQMLSTLPKKTGKRVLALDNATLTTGYSVYENGKLLSYGVKEIDNKTPQGLRIAYMKQWLISMLVVWDIDAVGLENVQYQGNAQTLIALAKLLGVLENACVEYEIEPYIVSAATWKSFCNIGKKGRQLEKEGAQNYVKRTYNLVVSQDAADAICLGAYVAYQERFGEEFSW